MAKKFFREYFDGLKELGVTGGAGLVASTVWDAGERFIPFQIAKDGSSREWLAPAAQLVTGVVAGPILGMWAPRLGTGLGVVLASEGGKKLLKSFLPAKAQKAIFGQVEITPLGWSGGGGDMGAPTSSAYYPPTVDVGPAQGDQAVLLGDGEMGQEASSTTIVPLGGFADASPVLLERVMSAIG